MFNPVHYSTCDLYEAAWLMYCGCELISITRIDQTKRCSFLFMGRGIMDDVKDWKNYKNIKFSPRAYAEKRDELKKLIPMQPEL